MANDECRHCHHPRRLHSELGICPVYVMFEKIEEQASELKLPELKWKRIAKIAALVLGSASLGAAGGHYVKPKLNTVYHVVPPVVVKEPCSLAIANHTRRVIVVAGENIAPGETLKIVDCR